MRLYSIIFLSLLTSLALAGQEPPVAGSSLPLDSSAIFRVDEIRYDIGDAFDDSKSHTKYDKWAFDLLNWFHIETREITVRKLLLFDEGDSVDLNYILEAERFLRDQNFLSDANITVSQDSGKNIANVHTSDNWTLTIPLSFGFGGSEWNYDNLNWGIGVQESNFLGLGQKLGFYFGHNEFRDMWQVEYGDPHFLIRYNHLDVLYSYNTDGYLASWQMYRPFLSRSVNQWAYTIAGLKNQRNAYFYGSGDMPVGAVPYESDRNRNPSFCDSLPKYNGEDAVQLMKVKEYIDDSLSFRLSRSFGGTQRKFYLGATYDYHRQTAEKGTLYRYVFADEDKAYVIDSASAWNEWLPNRKDSRVGAYLQYSNLRYEKMKNFHNVKWTEDVDNGWLVKAQISKNYEQLGAADNDIRLDFWLNLYLGRNHHHLTLLSESYFYLDHGKRHDFFGRVKGEYIFHPNNSFSTALFGFVDAYDDASLGYQLTLGGIEGFAGFPTGFYAGQARVYGSLEQRWFPNFEFATVMPVFVAFASVGETAWNLKDINRDDLIYVLGFGARFAVTKSIRRLIDKFDVSFPMNGARKGEPHFSITTTLSL
ncbi:MAG: hypothetical protein MJY82_10005 [Fibrobacter sp.]|nr:hypothetical protein [Fibrobacter sp.]